MPGRLTGKRVLITGTGGGQGQAAQALFAREGARVVGCDVREGSAESAAEALVAEGLDVRGMTVDLADSEQARSWVEQGVEHLGGGLDVLYNNAAGFGFAPFSEFTFELWSQVLRVELDLVFHTTSAAWPHLLAGNGGSVITTASISANRGIGGLGQAAHSAAKGAVVALTRTLAAEGAPHNVRVNCLSPGFVASPATDAAVDAAGREYMVAMHLIQRPGTPEDIAPLAVYLASDESSWVTGQNIRIDGGWTAGYR